MALTPDVRCYETALAKPAQPMATAQALKVFDAQPD
jgi:hypothetical protein